MFACAALGRRPRGRTHVGFGTHCAAYRRASGTGRGAAVAGRGAGPGRAGHGPGADRQGARTRGAGRAAGEDGRAAGRPAAADPDPGGRHPGPGHRGEDRAGTAARAGSRRQTRGAGHHDHGHRQPGDHLRLWRLHQDGRDGHRHQRRTHRRRCGRAPVLPAQPDPGGRRQRRRRRCLRRFPRPVLALLVQRRPRHRRRRQVQGLYRSRHVRRRQQCAGR